MSEDQERFEDYLELERYIQELQAGHVAHPPDELTPSQARIYRMVALFRAAGPEGAEPRPEFAAELRAQLEQELAETAPTQKMAALRDRRSKQAQKRPKEVSRRALLAGGAAAALGYALHTARGSHGLRRALIVLFGTAAGIAVLATAKSIIPIAF